MRVPSARLQWTALLAVAGAFACPAVWAVEERELKTAIVFNLLLFAEWPVDAAAPRRDNLVLCVAPSSPLNGPLKALHGRAVRRQHLDVRELLPGAPLSAWSACQAVYVDASGPERPRGEVPASAWAGTLVICDDLADAPPWATVILRRLGTRIGFDVNLGAARVAQVQLSSKLLRLARTVKG